jgi:hypothetical protein
MRIRTFLSRVIRDAQGVATSLIEAGATIAVGTVLAGVAINGGLDTMERGKVEAAKNDVQVIGQAVTTFFRDNSFYPMFKDGTKTGPDDDFFNFLVSENGTYPSPDFGDTWQIGNPATYPVDTGRFGHIVNVNQDRMEGHLVLNVIQNVLPGSALILLPGTNALANGSQSAYPVRGFLTSDPNRGWAGPYIDRLPKTDPWGDKYMINMQEFSPKHIRQFHAIAGQPLPRRVVLVLSAGPNRQIETSSEQPFETFQISGDDIAFRIQ